MSIGMIVLKVIGFIVGCFLFLLAGFSIGKNDKKYPIFIFLGLLMGLVAAFAR